MRRKTIVWIVQRSHVKGNLKRETESLLITVQNNIRRAKYVNEKFDKMQQNSKCRLCEEKDGPI